ncbi:NAD(P)/FAD-dependent oxidoreductase [Arenicella xantha]|uniref:Aminoacetone oxidase family FAD-binding enzyme n=1 Tax=Arenicella xantha TaxID=644221 RepID=A0A395JGP2_9GAMM|nr:NAD(P)/FAD-dependent oxidoreductase [Arenicella xantha]RBP49150.1 hypothetical protein DFR28_10476 [Arenicella xantha]
MRDSHVDVVVLGGGAAGLFAAATAAQRGRRVLLLEASNKLGKKILMSGGGRCNFTNLEVNADNFICPNPHFVKSALKQYTNWDFIALVSKSGIDYHEKGHGQLFADHSAKDILAMLVGECQAAGVQTQLNTAIVALTYDQCYHLQTTAHTLSADSVVVATGGLSIPTLGGATGFGYSLARQFGLTVNPTIPSLVPMTLTGKWHSFSTALAGVSLPVVASVASKGFAESLLFTHRGISGPAILQLSNYWELGESITLDLLPSEEVDSLLAEAKRQSPKMIINTLLIEYLPKSLVLAMQEVWWPHKAGKTLHEFSFAELSEIALHINAWDLTPSGTEGYRTAEVTRGGVDVAKISSKTMQVQGHPGLFFIGEVLDVTGHLGGFNFQWAWSSGYVAGQNA